MAAKSNEINTESGVPIRVYADISVYGVVFDEKFRASSRIFFRQVRSRYFQLVVSAAIRDEISGAPPVVRDFFDSVRGGAEEVPVSRRAVALQELYIKAGIVGAKWQTDALHVALATVASCRLIVSWNFKHIVHFDKIAGYNAVNAAHGYGALAIHAPPEVIRENDG